MWPFSAPPLEVTVVTDVGLVRERNEDNFLVADPIIGRVYTSKEVPDRIGTVRLPAGQPALVAVADGMGGMKDGELASRLTVQIVAQSFSAGWMDPKLSRISPADILSSAVRDANARLWARCEKKRQTRPSWRGMGATFTGAVFFDGEIRLVHVGDSRAYRLTSRGTLLRLTEDHTLTADLQRLGQLSPEEAAVHKYRHILVRSVGADEEVQPDSIEIRPEPGDILLICTDGLYNKLNDDEIRDVLLHSNRELRTACRILVDTAINRGGEDNITTVAFVCPKPVGEPKNMPIFGQLNTFIKKILGIAPVPVPPRRATGLRRPASGDGDHSATPTLPIADDAADVDSLDPENGSHARV